MMHRSRWKKHFVEKQRFIVTNFAGIENGENDIKCFFDRYFNVGVGDIVFLRDYTGTYHGDVAVRVKSGGFLVDTKRCYNINGRWVNIECTTESFVSNYCEIVNEAFYHAQRKSFINKLWDQVRLRRKITWQKACGQHHETCLMSKLNVYCWDQILKYLNIKDVLKLQGVCSCGLRVADRYFIDSSRKQLTLKFCDTVHKSEHMYKVHNHRILRLLARHKSHFLQSLTLDLDGALEISFASVFMPVIQSFCPNLKVLKVLDVDFDPRRLPIAELKPMVLETLVLTSRCKDYLLCVPPTLDEYVLKPIFKQMKSLQRLELKQWDFDMNIFQILPPTINFLKLSGRFVKIPTSVIAERLPDLKSLHLKVNYRGYYTNWFEDPHFLRFRTLEELCLYKFPVPYNLPQLLAPQTIKKLSVTEVDNLREVDINQILRQCQWLERLKIGVTCCLRDLELSVSKNLKELIFKGLRKILDLPTNIPLSIEVIRFIDCELLHRNEERRFIRYANEKLVNLVVLDLRFNYFSDSRDLAKLLDVRRFPKTLQVFHYVHDHVSDTPIEGHAYIIHPRRPDPLSLQWDAIY